MVYKKKLPLAVLISMATMLLMHLILPINLRSDQESEDPATANQKRAVTIMDIEACPADGLLLPEDTPYWSERIEQYQKFTDIKFVGKKPYTDVCCAPDNFTMKTFGYVQPPLYTEKSKNPCWYDGKRLRCVPYFFIIGATKSGTNDIMHRIQAHPDVATDTRREVHWFSRLRTLGAELRWYSSVFNPVAKTINAEIRDSGSSKKVFGEASLGYLSDVHVWPHFTGNQGCYEPRISIPNHIRYLIPNAKIIISLREPIDRLFSVYLYSAAARERLKDPSNQKFHDHVIRAVPAYKECFKRLPVRACVYNRTLSKLHPIDVISSAYAPFVEDWLRVFPREQVYVVKFEDYSKDMAGTTKDIYEFLELPPLSDYDFQKMKEMPVVPQNVYYKVSPIQNRTVKVLRELYTPFNNRLAKMLGKLNCIPYFFMVGVFKCGTTDLFRRITRHPEVLMGLKEIHWFTKMRRFGPEYQWQWYLDQFAPLSAQIDKELKAKGKSDLVIGEGSVSYFSDSHMWPDIHGNEFCAEPRLTVASHVHHLNPNAKIILSLRNPTSRLYSKYLFTAKSSELFKNPSPQQFHQYVGRSVRMYSKCMETMSVRACAYNHTLARRTKLMLHEGMYSVFLEDWFRIFPRNQIYIVRMEDYSPNIPGELAKIYDFLELKPLSSQELQEIANMSIVNTGKNYDVGPMNNKSYWMLNQFYRPFNERLARLLKDEKWTWKKD
nr:hypothetical protein BaRGS_026500 [Batillaria attramentaria]